MRNAILRYLLWVLFVIIAVPHVLWAHPHAYVANRFTVLFDDQGMAAIRVNWVFDKFFSSMLLEEFNSNGNDTLEDDEITAIKKGAFDNLAQFNFFLHIKIDGKPFTVKWVRDFTARLRDGALIYEFSVPCHVPAGSRIKEIRVAPYDPSFYTCILFAETQAVRIEKGPQFFVDYKIEKNPKEAYYFGMVEPYEMVLQFYAQKS